MTAPTPYTPPEGHRLCLLSEVKPGEVFRIHLDDPWHTRTTYFEERFVEARSVRQPDPRPYITNHEIVTTAGEMRDRTDLDQWERASDPGWYPIIRSTFSTAPDEHPVIVRRKQATP